MGFNIVLKGDKSRMTDGGRKKLPKHDPFLKKEFSCKLNRYLKI